MANHKLTARVNVKKQSSWHSKHLTFTQRIERMIDVWNPKGKPSAEGLKATTKAFQSIIRDAARKGKRVRALGSGWSSSRVAACQDWIVNTKPLNWIFPLSERSISDAYAGDPKHLLMAQCGVAVLELNNYLATQGQSLKASGASNGQTIAGALSTGTHGSAFKVGAIPNYVVGLHLIVGGSRHVWLERASYPVANDAFAAKLGAELIRDDRLFNAALVSFGSFGIIHLVMIETEPLFLLDAHRLSIPFDDRLKQAVSSLDFSNLPLPGNSDDLYHIECIFNPYDLDGGARATVMYKRPYTDDYEPPGPNADGFRPGDDAPGFIGLLSDAVPSLIPTLVNGLIDQIYAPHPPKTGTLGEIFYNSTIRGKSAAASLGVPQNMAAKALETALAAHKAHGPFMATVALRFVKGSKGLLAFTRFDQTCVVDIDGVLSDRTRRFFDRVPEAFAEADIPFTMHWGKLNAYLNPERVRRSYEATVDLWLASRHALLDAPSRAVFTNAFLERCGLDGEPLVWPEPTDRVIA